MAHCRPSGPNFGVKAGPIADVVSRALLLYVDSWCPLFHSIWITDHISSWGYSISPLETQWKDWTASEKSSGAIVLPLHPVLSWFCLLIKLWGVIQRYFEQESSQSSQESFDACTAVLVHFSTLFQDLFKMQASYAIFFVDICETQYFWIELFYALNLRLVELKC